MIIPQDELKCSPTDKDNMEHFRSHFIELGLPHDAIEWLLMVVNASQVFDDYADGDHVKRKDLDNLIYSTLVLMPSNTFFQRFSGSLLPVLSNVIMKWKASDTAERCGQADEKSFMWRAGFYDIILAVVTIVHGHEKAFELSSKVLSIYGETYKSYKEEFIDG